MKKAFYLLISLGLAGFIVVFVAHALQATAYVNTHGSEGTLVIDKAYGESRWSRPLPLKKVHAYTATLAPNHEVVLMSDQVLDEQRSYQIRFITREKLGEARRARLRPIPGAIRLRTANDPAPVKKDATTLFNILIDRAMGTAVVRTPSGLAPPALGTSTAYVPFLLVADDENFIETLWHNSRPGEWAFLLIAVLLLNALVKHAWILPWRRPTSKADQKDFVHPSLRTIDASPIPNPRPPIGFASTVVQSQEPLPLPNESEQGPVLKLPRR